MVLAPWLERWYRKATKENASANLASGGVPAAEDGGRSSQDNMEDNNDKTNH
jgi:hypothetical protein